MDPNDELDVKTQSTESSPAPTQSDEERVAAPADQQPEDTPKTETETPAASTESAAKADEAPKQAARDSLLNKWASDLKEPEPEAPKPADPAQPEAKAPPAPEPLELTDTDRTASPKAQERIRSLIERNKQTESRAKLADEIIGFCQQNNFTPEEYHDWVRIGAGLQRGDPLAKAALVDLAKTLGITQTQTPALPADFDAFLAKLEEDADISPSAVKALKAKLATPPPAPPAPAPVAQPSQQAPQRWTPQEEMQAVQTIDTRAQAIIARHGVETWKVIEPKVKARLSQNRGRHPDAWVPLFDTAVAAEIAALPKSTTKPVTAALSPTKTSSSATPSFKSERDRVLARFGR